MLIVEVSNIHGIKTYKSPDVIQKSTIYFVEHNKINLLYAF